MFRALNGHNLSGGVIVLSLNFAHSGEFVLVLSVFIFVLIILACWRLIHARFRYSAFRRRRWAYIAIVPSLRGGHTRGDTLAEVTEKAFPSKV
jgi:hypothetical protein